MISINSPKSAVIERMGSDSQIAHQIYSLVICQPQNTGWRLGKGKRGKGKGLNQFAIRNGLRPATLTQFAITFCDSYLERDTKRAATRGRGLKPQSWLKTFTQNPLPLKKPSFIGVLLMVRQTILASWLGLGYV